MSKCFLCDEEFTTCCYFCPFCKEAYCKFCYDSFKLDKACVKCEPENKNNVAKIKYLEARIKSLQTEIRDIKDKLDVTFKDDAIAPELQLLRKDKT